MRPIIRFSGIVLVILLILFIVAYFAIYHISRESVPDYNQTITIKGLHKQVTVFRDSFAIPHVIAENEEDLYRVTGYLMAQDRLWQMDVLRRATYGRLSEIFGKKTLKTDILMRALRIGNKSDMVISRSDKRVLQAMEAFTDGVNQYILKNWHTLPLEFKILHYKPESWKIKDSFNLLGYMAWDLNGSWNSEILLHLLIARLGREKSADFFPRSDSIQHCIYGLHESDATALDWRSELLGISSTLQDLGLQIFHGSNNWVISGSKTATGKPILANDMHLGFSIPGVWYQIHQVIPGKLDVTGVILPGEPFVVAGHNQHIAWGLTNVMNDDIDFYSETLNGKDSTQYKVDGHWRNLSVQKESFAIKGNDTVHLILRFTHRGPIISMLKNLHHESISMHWLGNEYSNEIRSIFLLNRATNWEEFCDAMKTFIAVSQNVVYADTDGNIGMYCCAGIPIRKGDPRMVQRGDTSAFDWKGFVPFDSLPHQFNPQKGYAISANNRTMDKTFHHYISAWFDLPYRYLQIDTLLKGKENLTISDIASIQTDQTSKLVQEYLPTLLSILKEYTNPTKNEKRAIAILQNWKGNMNEDISAPAIFEVFYNRFAFNLFHDKIGDTLFNSLLSDKIILRQTLENVWKNKTSTLFDTYHMPKEMLTFRNIVIQTFRESIDYLEKKFGEESDQWEWGKIHTLTLEHPLGQVEILDKIFQLNRGPFPVSGSFHTIAPFSYRYSDLFHVVSGASQRHIYDLSNWDASLSVIPTGNCGISSSTHYCDQTNLYLSGKYHMDAYSIPKIATLFLYKAIFVPSQK